MRLKKSIVQILLPIVVILILHYFWTVYHGGPDIVVYGWSIVETKLNFFWQKYLPIWKFVLLGSTLINILLLDLWLSNPRYSPAHSKGKVKPLGKGNPEIDHQALRAENTELKQQLKISGMDLKLNDKTREEHEQQQWAQVRQELESQLEQANLGHEKTRQAFSELQEKLNCLTQQLEEVKGWEDSSQSEPKQADGDSDSNLLNKARGGMQSQSFKSNLKNLKDIIDRNDLA